MDLWTPYQAWLQVKLQVVISKVPKVTEVTEVTEVTTVGFAVQKVTKVKKVTVENVVFRLRSILYC